MSPGAILVESGLRGVPCPACGSAESTEAFSADDFMLGIAGPFFVARCATCGLLFQNPRIATERLTRHYPDDYGPYSATDMTLPSEARRVLRDALGYAHLDVPEDGFAASWNRWNGRAAIEAMLLPSHVPGGRLVEIGCASGARLSLLRKLGWERCTGIEWGAGAAERARARGFDILAEPVEKGLEEFPDAALDAVLAGFVMEHVEDPFRLAERVAAKLKPGGEFLFSTLAVGAPDFRIYGPYWYDLDLPRHMTFFRKKDILRMLEGRFRLERITHLVAPQDWTGSARYRLRREGGIRAHPFARTFDALILAARRGMRPACTVLAALGLTSRVAVRCVRT